MRKTFIFVLLSFFTALSFAKPQEEKPAWIDNLNTIYPDSLYIAKLGKAQGAAKLNAVLAQENADNNVAEYLNVTIRSETVSKTNYETKIEAGKLSTSETKDNSRIIQTSVNMTLSGLSHTDAWYNKKEKTWYCVAYVSRDKAYEAYKPTVTDGRNKFLALYEKAEAEKDYLKKCIILRKAQNEGKDFLNSYNFAILLNKQITENDFYKDRENLATIPARIKELVLKSSINITVENDYASNVYSSIANSLSEIGFRVQESNSQYHLFAKIKLNQKASAKIVVLNPSVSIIIKNSNENIYSFNCHGDEVKAFAKETAHNLAAENLAEHLTNELVNDFESIFGILNYDLILF